LIFCLILSNLRVNEKKNIKRYLVQHDLSSQKPFLREDPRWWIGEGIRIPELCDFRNIEMKKLHLGNSDSF
jgi:hypothetical protein